MMTGAMETPWPNRLAASIVRASSPRTSAPLGYRTVVGDLDRDPILARGHSNDYFASETHGVLYQISDGVPDVIRPYP